jgi:hypothetical protein
MVIIYLCYLLFVNKLELFLLLCKVAPFLLTLLVYIQFSCDDILSLLSIGLL